MKPRRDLIIRLRECGAEVARRCPGVNYGGCGLYAANVAQALSASGIVVRGRVASWEAADEKTNIDQVRERNSPRSLGAWNRAGIFVGHLVVVLQHEGELWHHDTENTVSGLLEVDATFGLPFYSGSLAAKEIIAMGRCRYGWNDEFRRDLFEKHLCRIVRKHLVETKCS